MTKGEKQPQEMLNLNLGSGSKRIEGFINLDKFDTFNPDIVHDLEIFPYPFKDSSVDKIILSHVMEHIGQTPDIFNSIMRELYRICKNQAIMDIAVPHPRHDDFLADPTHVRPITVLGLSLYDKEKNRQWKKENQAYNLLGLIHNVNFKIIDVRYDVTKDYIKMLKEKKITQEKLFEMIERYNNIVKQIFIQLKVIKDE
tara:strand:- start:49 stop:645 length:597 start_codon:yes stop_codon:yes gene_type:complete